ncbi:MAG: type III pantothenate kinase [Cyclobacteriaceae bacterium]
MEKDRSNVIVDIGNSRIKVAIFQGEHLQNKWTVESISEISSLALSHSASWIVSSVRKNQAEINDFLEDRNYLFLTHQTPLPISLDYKTPETLGVDRIAAAVAGNQLHPHGCVVIDAGTCLTIEHVDAQGVYRGGVISPGLIMRMKAMHTFTDGLPDISENWQNIPLNEMGKSTYGCLMKGAFEGIIHELNGYIEVLKKDNPRLGVILTGGDAKYFETKLKAPIFADLNLVLKGLNTILNYNK